jgi:CBS domain-containing protein
MMTVRDVMTQSVVSARASTPLKDVVKALVENRISGLPVVDEDGTVIGVVSEGDLLVKAQGPDAIRHRPLARFLGESARTRTQLTKLGAVTAAEAMTAPAITIEASQSIHEAASIMTAKAVNRLPVLDDGRLIGIVTRADLVRAYVRSDEELARTIREDVILRVLWLDPAVFTVTVKDGVVSIVGEVDRRSTAEIIERSVRMVPGVIDLRGSVAWRIDDSRASTTSADPAFPYSPH